MSDPAACAPQRISEHLYQFEDTCCAYAVITGDRAVLVDFGDGALVHHLPALGVRRVTDILFTHHHRDQCQGLRSAISAGLPLLSDTRVWVPHAERHFFQNVERHWQAREIENNYDVRQDRFSLLEDVPVTGTLRDYHAVDFNGIEWRVLPAPGHTPGGIALLACIDGQRAAFTGDLICAPGKVWSMAALQWSYQGMAGAAASIPVLNDLKAEQPDLLLPSHGAVMDGADKALDDLAGNLRRLLDARGENLSMPEWLEAPYTTITPHLLLNRTSVSNSYVLLSESGAALFIDFGYDFLTSLPTGSDRSLHRPWLHSIPSLKRDFGVQRIEVVVATHYHDDHVAGMNLLREAEGTEVWASEVFAGILEQPGGYNLPCLWYEPVPVDIVLRGGEAVCWREYTLKVHPLPGHTRYASAVEFCVDGKRVLATGDQHKGHPGEDWNYVYQNRFEIGDYSASAALYAAIAPDLILPGHWQPLWTDAAFFHRLEERGKLLEGLHRSLLPLETIDLGMEGFAARIMPYQVEASGGCPIDYVVEARNPLLHPAQLRVSMVLPEGWRSLPEEQLIYAEAGETVKMGFAVVPAPGASGTRIRLAVDVSAGDTHLGQQAEALVDLPPVGPVSPGAGAGRLLSARFQRQYNFPSDDRA